MEGFLVGDQRDDSRNIHCLYSIWELDLFLSYLWWIT